MEHWLKTYGYLGLFLGTFFGGEETLILAALLAGLGYFDLKWVIVVAALGGSMGDQVYFFIVRDRAVRLIQKSPHLSRLYPKICSLMQRYGTLIVFLSRFLAGIRIMIPVICATTRMSPFKYSILSLTSATLWASGFGYLAYKMGPPMFDVLKRFRGRWYFILAGIIVVLLAGLLVRRTRRVARRLQP